MKSQMPHLTLRGRQWRYHLGAVGEVTELRFDPVLGLRSRVAILETEHGFFREHRIDDQEVTLVGGDVLQRRVRSRVPFFAVLIVKHRMPMEERATA
jgi:hypothetical protein